MRRTLAAIRDALRPRCAVITAAWGRCTLKGVTTVRVNGTGVEDLILPLCATHAAMFGATRPVAA